MRYTFLFIVACCLLWMGCNPQPEAPILLKQAQQLMEQRPDSAMLLIDSIFYPEESLRKLQYMQYLVARVQARYKNYRPIAEDTLVFTARDYFVRHNKESKQTTLAYFYSGCVYREQRNYEKAMQQYKCAERYADKARDVDLQGLVQYNMGDLFNEQSLYTQALEKYKVAESFYRQSLSNTEEKQAKCLDVIGQMYSLVGQQNQAIESFKQGVVLSYSTNNHELQRRLTQNLSVAYREAGQYVDAKTYLQQSFILIKDSSELSRYHLNFAKLYTQTNQTDSLAFYKNKLIEKIDSVNEPLS